MDIVDQILAQSHAGSADGASFIDSYFKGAQLGNDRRRLNLESQKLDLERAKMVSEAKSSDIRNDLMRQTIDFNNDMQKFQLIDAKTHMENTRLTQEGATAAGALIAELNTNPELAESPEFKAKVGTLFQNRTVLGTDQGKHLFKTIQTYQDTKQALGKYGLLPSSLTVKNDDGTSTTFTKPGVTLEQAANLGLGPVGMFKDGTPRYGLPRSGSYAANVIPVIQEVDGKRFLVNPKTGHATELDKMSVNDKFKIQYLYQRLRSVQGEIDKIISDTDTKPEKKAPALAHLRKELMTISEDMNSVGGGRNSIVPLDNLADSPDFGVPSDITSTPGSEVRNVGGKPTTVYLPTSSDQVGGLTKGTPFVNPSDGRIYYSK